ncbi:gliding motility-associated C-terminal domain-containing protein [Aquimarina sp. 2201CG1-2-11]|uniref:gliding motility-associated C-terminal domain-containing protein n=1 Tax=Aquimarina discodermiae TaxID=3231043 RepID=UPI0034637A8E
MKLTNEKLVFLGKKLVILSILFVSCYHSYSQCNQVLPDITQCDMENVDFDINGDPDGIINIYIETGTTVVDGVWSIDPRFTSAFDPATGNLAMWALQNSTTLSNINDYTFELRNATCGTDPAMTVRLVLGPYSGVALPPFGINNINVETCDEGQFDLFEALVSDSRIPPPHLNGVWEYRGTSPNFIAINDGHLFNAEIPYQPGLPLVDQEVFEVFYVVPGMTPCDPVQETTIRISVVRQVDPGTANPTQICEDDILAGLYDADINLRDDAYLVGEDNEGVWSAVDDPTMQISNEQDSMVNLREVYDDLIDGGNNLRFGCATYNFTYTAESRSAVCNDMSTSIPFTFYEQVRPFIQINLPQLCINRDPSTFDLFSTLDFAVEGGQSFVYNSDYKTNWRLVSGPSDLGLLTLSDEDYSHRGKISVVNAQPGTYIFEYGVHPNINCDATNTLCDPFASMGDLNYCPHPCPAESTLVSIDILAFDYAGEDTIDVHLCESLGQVDLVTLLNTNGSTVATTGVWTDGAGTITNPFVFPNISGSQTFNFTYTTNSVDGCIDVADLEFTIYAESNAGTSSTITVCSDDLTVTLFDLLGGNPDTTGSWTGPFGYNSNGDHLGVFDQDDTMLPILGEGVYTYTVPGSAGCASTDESTITVSIVSPVTIGTDRSETFCKLDGRVNLYSLLDRDTPRTGVFEDTDNTMALSADGVLEFETLTNDIYDFRYVIANTLPCDESSLIVSVQIVDLPIPNVPDPEFCILDAKRLEDIEVDVLNYNWYDALESETPIIDNPLLFDQQVYYVATVDADNCESERLEVKITILNTGEKFKNGELCTLDFQDGVSPNGDGQNDTFDLMIDETYNIPEAFPDFDLKIYNRYGSLVYEGNIDTEEFRGGSNVSLSLGDDLPTGTYFYVFNPNFENNLPIQGSFYLSR